MTRTSPQKSRFTGTPATSQSPDPSGLDHETRLSNAIDALTLLDLCEGEEAKIRAAITAHLDGLTEDDIERVPDIDRATRARLRTFTSGYGAHWATNHAIEGNATAEDGAELEDIVTDPGYERAQKKVAAILRADTETRRSVG